MTFSIFRSKWVFGTSISISTTIASFLSSFFHFSIKPPPFPLLYRKRGILHQFFDKLSILWYAAGCLQTSGIGWTSKQGGIAAGNLALSYKAGLGRKFPIIG